MPVKRYLALFLLPVLVLVAACGSDGEAVTSDSSGPDQTAGDDGGPSTTGAQGDLPAGAVVANVSDDLSAKPTVVLEPADEAPADVVIDDVVVGDGALVSAEDTVEVQYVGMLTDSTEFDSSWDRGEPATFPLSGVIAGWGEGLVGMAEGGRRTLVIPAEKGYGEQGSPPTIPPGATLVFVVDLISIDKPAPAGVELTSVSDDLTAKPEVEVAPADEAPAEVVVEDVVTGDGAAVVAADDPRVEVHYVGLLTDGTEFESSWEAEPVQANLSQVIPGWRDGLDGMQVGGRRALVIPASQAYGDTGAAPAIPPGATLVFVIDLISLPG